MDRAVRASDRLDAETMKRVQEIYGGALKTALQTKRTFFEKVADVYAGKYVPPVEYNTEAKVQHWREGFIAELARQQNLINGMAGELAKAGQDASQVIQDAMSSHYGIHREFTVGLIGGKAEKAGLEVNFNQYSKRQIDILLEDAQPPFSKIAYRNMGKDTLIVRRLQNEMAQAVILGESREKMLKRIQKVTGQSVAQARRVAQTERNRIQSQARQDVLNEAAQKGVKTTKEWSARMKNTRDTHAALDGVIVGSDEPFVSASGAHLMYPCEPGAPAAEVVNCFCVMIPDVVVDRKAREATQKHEETTITPQFKAAETKAEAVERLKQYTESGDFVVRGDYSLSMLNAVSESMDEAYSMFGNKLKITGMERMGGSDGRYRQGAYDPKTHMLQLKNSSMAQLVKSAERDFASKWSPSNHPRGVIRHEIGHAVWEDLNEAARGKILGIYQDAKHANYLKWVEAGESRSAVSQAEMFGGVLSKYAIESPEEFFSEAFSQILDKRPRPVSRSVRKVLFDEYKSN